ncbi:hypothetical protein RvY_04495 [Ramazzottius varieornatus]|uniref:Uncharacterized protein n=1 Tax=Ramazzottius varieornatus TaxID=947166 RepID=A0A1D1UXJ4_RAMVA|nr:hypothetical protein RvY_04495 [Ramazzottius varieornatus]
MLGGNGEGMEEGIIECAEPRPAKESPPGPDIADENGGKPKKPGARSKPAREAIDE